MKFISFILNVSPVSFLSTNVLAVTQTDERMFLMTNGFMRVIQEFVLPVAENGINHTRIDDAPLLAIDTLFVGTESSLIKI